LSLAKHPPLSPDDRGHLSQCDDEGLRHATFVALFKKYCGKTPDAVARAGGRVNLIGEHVDYPDLQFKGEHPSHLTSMGGSIQNSFMAGVARRIDRELHLHHLDAGESFTAGLDQLLSLEASSKAEREQRMPMKQRCVPEWAHHSMACLRQLHRLAPLTTGLDVLLTSNVPHGAGMSNSAANCVALTLCFKKVYGISGLDDPQSVVDFARTSERSDFVGGQCGYLDQMLIVHSRKGQLTSLDYAGNKVAHFPSALTLPWQFVAINTLVPHVLAESDYTIRVRELQAGITLLRKVIGKDIGSLFLSMESYNLLLEQLIQCPPIHLPLKDEGHVIGKGDIPGFLNKLLSIYQKPELGTHDGLKKEASLGLLLRRMRHQKSSSLLVPEAGRLAQSGDGEGFGRLLNLEGESLRMRGDFQITGSNGAQDALLDAGFESGTMTGMTVYGRMLGGGGGGNVLFLVKRETESGYAKWLHQTRKIYKEWSAKQFGNSGIEASVVEPAIGAGASLIN